MTWLAPVEGSSNFAPVRKRFVIGRPLACLLRLLLGLGIVAVAFWWPVYYIHFRIPPGDDDRSGMALIAGEPFALAGAIYATWGVVNLWKETTGLTVIQRFRWRVVAGFVVAAASFPAGYLLFTGGLSGFWMGVRMWL